MARKPLFETLMQQLSSNFTSVVIVVIGAVAFYYITRRKPGGGARPPLGATQPSTRTQAQRPTGSAVVARAATTVSPPAAGETVLQKIKRKGFVGSKVCVVFEIFYKNGSWAEEGKAKDVLAWYAFSSDLYIMCKVGAEEEIAEVSTVLRSVEGVQRHKILFCSTQKGYEAFTRQINPALLITNDKPEAAFLSGVLPYIALVGEDGVAKPNVACVPSATALACDNAA